MCQFQSGWNHSLPWMCGFFHFYACVCVCVSSYFFSSFYFFVLMTHPALNGACLHSLSPSRSSSCCPHHCCTPPLPTRGSCWSLCPELCGPSSSAPSACLCWTDCCCFLQTVAHRQQGNETRGDMKYFWSKQTNKLIDWIVLLNLTPIIFLLTK